MSMVEISLTAINFGYDFVLLVHFLGHPVVYAPISHHFITSDSVVILIASPTEAKNDYGLFRKQHSSFSRSE